MVRGDDGIFRFFVDHLAKRTGDGDLQLLPVVFSAVDFDVIGSCHQIERHFLSSSQNSLDGLVEIFGERSQDLAVFLGDLIGEEVSVLAADGDAEGGVMFSVGWMDSIFGGGEGGGLACRPLLDKLVGAFEVDLVDVEFSLSQYYFHLFSHCSFGKNCFGWIDSRW